MWLSVIAGTDGFDTQFVNCISSLCDTRQRIAAMPANKMGYERILFMDSDIIITDNSPDLFALVPDDRFGAWFVNPMIPGRFAENIAHVQAALGRIGWVSGYFNSGVMVLSRAHRSIFEDPQDYSDMFFEQTLLNYRVQAGRYLTFDLGYRWNHTCAVFSDRRLHSYFIHYAGPGHIRGMSRAEQIRTDLGALGKL